MRAFEPVDDAPLRILCGSMLATTARVAQLSSLLTLQVHGNRLSGVVPAQLSELSGLSICTLTGSQAGTGSGSNRFDCPLPTLSNACGEELQCGEALALQALYVSKSGVGWRDSSNWLSSASVCTWFGVECDDNGNVAKLNLERNGLAGSLPDLTGLPMLAELSLARNRLSGSIVSSLLASESLRTLQLGGAEVSGTLPDSMGGALEVLDLNGVAEISGTCVSFAGPLYLRCHAIANSCCDPHVMCPPCSPALLADSRAEPPRVACSRVPQASGCAIAAAAATHIALAIELCERNVICASGRAQ